jgi:hypothetical protein
MAYTRKDWERRIADRTDMCAGLVHLTRETSQSNVFEVLLKILIDQKLIGSTTEMGFICGDRKAVCFQDAPLYSISQNVFFEQKQIEHNSDYKLRYRAIGLAFSKDYLFMKGARPVVHEQTDTAKEILPPDEWWRIVRLDLSDPNSFVDWTHEREWRLPGDLEFELSEATLLMITNSNVKDLAKRYMENTGKDLRDELRGIVTLRDVLF